MYYFLDLHFDEEDNISCEFMNIKTLEVTSVTLDEFNRLVREEQVANCSIQIEI